MNFINIFKRITNRLIFLFRKKAFAHCDTKIFLSSKARIIGKNKIYLYEGCSILPYAILDAGNTGDIISIGNNSIIHEYTFLKAFDGQILIGNNCTVNPFTVIHGCSGGVIIGNGVRIASGCSLVANEHIFKSTNIPIYLQGTTSKGIIIEDDVWLGSGVKVLDGVTVGKGSVVGANSVVTKNIPSYSVAVGSPARIIKARS